MPIREKLKRELGDWSNEAKAKRIELVGASPPPPPPPSGFLDEFTRANETPVASPWSTPGWAYGPMNLVSNALVSPGVNVRGSVVDTTSYGLSAAVIITADFTVNSGGSPDVGVALSSGSDWLLFYNVNTSWGIYRQNGSNSTTATVASGAGAPGGAINKVFEVTAVGTTYIYKINGTTLWSGTYAPLTRTSLVHGWYHSHNDDTNTLNSFRVDPAVD